MKTRRYQGPADSGVPAPSLSVETPSELERCRDAANAESLFLPKIVIN
jgi:hypothetical protein